MWFLRRRETESSLEAKAALEDAEKNLKRVQKRGDEVSRVSELLREFRERNHIAEQLDDIIAFKRGPG